MSQTILFTYFEFDTLRNKWFAFQNMGLGVDKYGLPEQMEWLRVMGSGSGNGFSIWPNWGGYALLAAFPDERTAKAALDSGLWKAYTEHSASAKTFFLRPLASHGLWDGVEPFRTSGSYDRELETAVLTRARVKNKHVPAFWKRVHNVAESIHEYPERLFSVGVGEIPLIQQVTLSHWTSGKAMEDYAYKSKYHGAVVGMARKKGWFSEELFCRFSVLDTMTVV
jgi:hypothetical protein